MVEELKNYTMVVHGICVELEHSVPMFVHVCATLVTYTHYHGNSTHVGHSNLFYRSPVSSVLSHRSGGT